MSYQEFDRPEFDETDAECVPPLSQAEFEEYWPSPEEQQEMNEAGFDAIHAPLPTAAEVDAMLADAPVPPPPDETELGLMEAYYSRHWNWTQPF